MIRPPPKALLNDENRSRMAVEGKTLKEMRGRGEMEKSKINKIQLTDGLLVAAGPKSHTLLRSEKALELLSFYYHFFRVGDGGRGFIWSIAIKLNITHASSSIFYQREK